MPFTEDQQRALLAVAEGSIRHGLDHGTWWRIDPGDYPEPLRAPRATFVTLEREGELRGCIGTLEPVRPLVEDVAYNAFAAAFSDPRFPPLRPPELAGMDLHISVLSPAEPMAFSSEADLVEQIRPGIDGLVLEEGRHRGTFLPSVWSQLPAPRPFLQHLKRKAGLPPDYWSDTLRVSRYTTESIGGRVAAA